MERVKGDCRQCGKGLTGQQRVYCSVACSGQTLAARRVWTPLPKDPAAWETRTCQTCGSPFQFRLALLHSPERNKGSYCSRACVPLNLGRKLTATCRLCGQTFSYYPSDRPGLSCGWKCPARIPAPYGRLQATTWKKRRAEVIARDGGQCLRCGDFPRVPQVHHIIAWEISRDDSMGNLVTLCRSCHRTIETAEDAIAQQAAFVARLDADLVAHAV